MPVPTGSTRSHTLFPFTTRFRSAHPMARLGEGALATGEEEEMPLQEKFAPLLYAQASQQHGGRPAMAGPDEQPPAQFPRLDVDAGALAGAEPIGRASCRERVCQYA